MLGESGDIELSEIKSPEQEDDDTVIRERVSSRRQTRRQTKQERLQKARKQLGKEAVVRTVDLTGGRYEGHGVGAEKYAGNSVQTAKYTPYNFLPKNLFEQLIRPANLYFLTIGIMQATKPISTSEGLPVIGLPLSAVIFFAMLKDFFEDKKRRQMDKEENDREFLRLKTPENQRGNQKTDKIRSEDLRVGDIVKILDDQLFPADLMLLAVGSDQGTNCFVETASLDGETSLKVKTLPDICLQFKKEALLATATLKLNCDLPNQSLDVWGGILEVPSGKKKKKGQKESVVSIDNLVLRGSKLRNSKWIYGVVVYAGEETKIRQNSMANNKHKLKRSTLEKLMNQQILQVFFIQCALCALCASMAGLWQTSHEEANWYLRYEDTPVILALKRFFTWFILLMGFVPISLLVSMEMVKYLQGVFMGWDLDMVAEVGGDVHFAKAQTSSLNEELGGIDYILSDKTGTLTTNSMSFRKALVGPLQFGTGDTSTSRAAKRRKSFEFSGNFSETVLNEKAVVAPHVNFNSRQAFKKVLAAGEGQVAHSQKNEAGLSNKDYCREYLTALTLCNTVYPAMNKKKKKMEMKASSSDEQALVMFAKFMGFELTTRNPPYVKLVIKSPEEEEIVKVPGAKAVKDKKKKKKKTEESKQEVEELTYTQLACLDFTSKRKRMSVVLQHPETKKIICYCKGADSSVLPLLEGENPNLDYTTRGMAFFGQQGLRTLVVAAAEQDEQWWTDDVGKKFEAAMRECAVEGPEEEGHFKGSCSNNCRRCAAEEAVERAFGLGLVGATAIEDKLQAGVPNAIKSFLDAGIRVWVLTGDKMETAINVGMAANLLETTMNAKGNLLRLTSNDATSIKRELDAHKLRLGELEKKQAANAGVPGAKQEHDPVGLIVSSEAFGVIAASEKNKQANVNLMEQFLYVALRCKAVVCCRMQPNQKAKIVQVIRDSEKAVTMAIGDGANDEPMIREAHVGVGIRGVEGTTAVRAADYVVAQFSFVRRLILVHGHNNYRRVSILVGYIFYKNALISLAFFWFGIQSGFSAQQLFLEWAFQLNNILYTAFPIIILALFDADMSDNFLLGNPVIYKLTQNNELFNWRVFWSWQARAFIHSFVIVHVNMIGLGSTAFAENGLQVSLWAVGIGIYTSIVICVNLKLALLVKSWTWLSFAGVTFSIAAFFVSLLFLDSPTWSVAGADYTGEIGNIYSSPMYWLTILIAFTSGLLIDFIFDSGMELGLVLCCKSRRRWHRLVVPSQKNDEETAEEKKERFKLQRAQSAANIRLN